MIYLILAILCSSCITLVLKVGARYTDNRYGMLTCNYITCVVLVAIFMPKNIGFPYENRERLVLILGLVNGMLFLICMAYNQINIVKNGAILTATFVRLGVLIPTIMSIIFYKETPTIFQAIGILFVLAAFVIMGVGNRKEEMVVEKTSIKALVCLMILGGITDSMSKIYEQTCSMELADWFLFITFAVALVCCIATMICKHQKIGVRECVLGVGIGIPNYFSTLFLLQALSKVPAFFAYPTYSVGSILVVLGVSCIVFREKLDFYQKSGMVSIIVSLILLNV